ncbi:MAG TPA: hypothetical protein VMV03_00705 [Spirochaetia bacterium]|nr:hypothetical protein [Spirochaetia bacterium]
MKRALIVAVICLVPGMMFANPNGPWMESRGFQDLRPQEAGPYYAAEIRQIDTEMAQQKLGDLNVAQLVAVRERLSIAIQKDAYVNRVRTESLFLPGLGQFETGDTTNGLLFMGLNLAVLTGTAFAVYYSLPDDVRFDKLDYIHSSFSTINNTWNGHTIVDYLPAFGVFVGGMIVDGLVRYWSSTNAADGARQKVNSGSVTFTPLIGPGFMGIGVAY